MHEEIHCGCKIIPQIIELTSLGDTSVHHGVFDVTGSSEFVALLFDLHRQLSRGGHDQHDGAVTRLKIRL